MPYEEISEILEISLGTVKSRILRGRDALKERLTAHLEPSPQRIQPDRRTGGAMKRYEERLLHSLPSMSTRSVPPDLSLALRVMASRQCKRQATRKNLAARVNHFQEWAKRFCDEFVWPMALPFTGGVASAIVLFSMCVVPAYPLRAPSIANMPSTDVPTILSTAVAVKGISPFVTSADEVVVDVWVDGEGRMFDYAIVAGASVLANSHLRRRLENMLLFTEFTPATEFGRPMSSKVRLRLGFEPRRRARLTWAVGWGSISSPAHPSCATSPKRAAKPFRRIENGAEINYRNRSRQRRA